MEKIEKHAVILDQHLNLVTIDDFADYLEKYFKRDKFKNFYFNIDATNENTLFGTIKGYYYNISYEYGKRASIMIDMGTPELMNALELAIAPTMWYVDEETLSPYNYCGPLLRYKSPTSSIIEWENFDPIGKLKSVAFEVYTNKTYCSDIEVLHPELSLEDFKEFTYYGNMDGYVPAEIQDEVDNFSEFELYYNIKQLYDYYNYHEKLEAKMEQSQENAQERIMYNIDYLLQKTVKYGVKPFKPSPQPHNLTEEQMAWYTWWDEAFTKLLEERPWTLQEWKKFPKGFDPEFRPKGSYRDYLIWVPNDEPNK